MHLTISLRRVATHVAFAAMVFGIGAQAMANPRANYQRLIDGLQELTQGAQLVNQGDRFSARVYLRRAYFKLKIAEVSLKNSYGHGSQAVEAIGVALAKIAPGSGLNIREKFRWGVDCVSVALNVLVNDSFHGRYAARLHLQVAKKLIKACFFDQAVTAIHSAQNKLFGYGVNPAIEALGVAIEKISSPALNAREKINWGLDCIGEALRLMQRFRF